MITSNLTEVREVTEVTEVFFEQNKWNIFRRCLCDNN